MKRAGQDVSDQWSSELGDNPRADQRAPNSEDGEVKERKDDIQVSQINTIIPLMIKRGL